MGRFSVGNGNVRRLSAHFGECPQEIIILWIFKRSARCRANEIAVIADALLRDNAIEQSLEALRTTPPGHTEG